MIDIVRFREQRQERWDRFASLLDLIQTARISSQTLEDLEEFALLYRSVVDDLSVARRDYPHDPIVAELNRLCATAYPLMHHKPYAERVSPWSFFASVVPQTFRRQKLCVFLSFATIFFGFLVGWLVITLHPNLTSELVPNSLFADLAEHKAVPPLPSVPLSGLAISTNNIKVVIISFMGGVLVGIPTAYILFTNGFTIGALGAAIHRAGYDAKFWPYLAPHGFLEMSIIIISGGAGYSIARSILFPGLRSRTDALSHTAGQAVALAIGTAFLLFVSGVIEAGISPSSIPAWLKIAIGLAVAACFYSWLGFGGRHSKEIEKLAPDNPGVPS